MSASIVRKFKLSALSFSLCVVGLGEVSTALAFDFGNMMNPSRWFGGGDRYDRYYDDWYGGPWGGPYGPYGYPGFYGAPYSWPGFGVPPVGYGITPGYGAAPTPAQPQSSNPNRVDPKEIETLKRRVEQLESRQQLQPPMPQGQYQGHQGQQSPEWPSMPGFRPMNQY
ncbi:hypothetical protein GWK36_13640 [Caldichromatium japonicum]|uniref:Uncharacterized protein n=1 Tax=Caldichromatium japonicum TaxID=2699430 RepID=A0A6G7VGC9_9GAMM|nr:hypothetical protein [Caldichromatium japonicum]QIK38847.1 hypothetical protein GWK36_13640 [Caldichromatium japonicum]